MISQYRSAYSAYNARLKLLVQLYIEDETTNMDEAETKETR